MATEPRTDAEPGTETASDSPGQAAPAQTGRRRRVRGGAHRGPRLTRRQRKAAERAVAAAETARTQEWFAQMRAMEDIDLAPAHTRSVTGTALAGPEVDESHLDEVWERWAAAGRSATGQ